MLDGNGLYDVARLDRVRAAELIAALRAEAAALRAERDELRAERDELLALVGGAAGLRRARLGERLLDVLPVVAAVGFAADVHQARFLCGATFRAGDKGATNDMLVCSLRLQCGERAAHEAARLDSWFFSTPADPGGAEYRGTTQLIRAAALNNLPAVRRLLALGAPVDLADFGGYSPLWWASHMGHEAVAEALLAAGAVADLPDARGVTPLMDASFQGHAAVVRLLLAFGASLECRTCEGGSALLSAVQRDNAQVLDMLLRRGPGAPVGARGALGARDSAGYTPLELAESLGHGACAALLRAAAARFDAEDAAEAAAAEGTPVAPGAAAQPLPR